MQETNALRHVRVYLVSRCDINIFVNLQTLLQLFSPQCATTCPSRYNIEACTVHKDACSIHTACFHCVHQPLTHVFHNGPHKLLIDFSCALDTIELLMNIKITVVPQ